MRSGWGVEKIICLQKYEIRQEKESVTFVHGMSVIVLMVCVIIARNFISNILMTRIHRHGVKSALMLSLYFHATS
jgi:hypothetical protein